MTRFRSLVPTLIAGVYFAVFGRFGFSGTDDGFISGLAWRIYRGQLIYRDFIYVRPPLTPLIHSAFMRLVPVNFYIVSERALTCSLILAYSYLATSILGSVFPEDESLRRYGWLYTSAFFVFSIHDFNPPFAWHTVDGVFFSVAGAWLLLRVRPQGDWAQSAAAAIFLVAAALTKQSFYPMPGLGLVWLLAMRRGMKELAPYIASCITLVMAFVLTLRHFGIWRDFLQQTRGATHIADAIRAGLGTYFILGAHFLGYCLVLILGIRILSPMFPRRHRWLSVFGDPLHIFLGVFLLLNVRLIVRNLLQGTTVFIDEPTLGYSQAMFLIALVFCIEEFRRNRANALSLALLLMTAWCASISWGYETPLFFSAPLIYGMVRLSGRYGGQRRPEHRVVAAILCSGLVAFALCDLYPYRDLDGRLHDHRDLVQLAPRLGGIYAGNQGYSKIQEFLSLEREYGPHFITLPAFTTSHFLTDTISPAPVDWALNAEMDGKTRSIFAKLNAENVYAIVDVQKSKEDSTVEPKYGSDLSTLVETHWQLVETGTWYEVYAAPKFLSPVP